MQELRPGFEQDVAFLEAINAPGPAAFTVKIDPEQTYFPKISSRVTASGSMESNPLHFMTPSLEEDMAVKVFRFLSPLKATDPQAQSVAGNLRYARQTM